jgi:hypothetical protein
MLRVHHEVHSTRPPPHGVPPVASVGIRNPTMKMALDKPRCEIVDMTAFVESLNVFLL